MSRSEAVIWVVPEQVEFWESKGFSKPVAVPPVRRARKAKAEAETEGGE